MSSYTLPEGFPHQLSDDEAEDALTSIVAVYRERYGDNVGLWLPELQLALMTVAISDQSRRQLVQGGRLAAVSLGVAVIALIVALVATIAG